MRLIQRPHARLRCTVLRDSALLATFLATAATAAPPPPAGTDPAAPGTIAYFDERFEAAVEAWRPLIADKNAGGVLLYRFALALDRSGGAEAEVKKIRRRSRKALEKSLAEGGGPVECCYLANLMDDEDRAGAARLATGCFSKFRDRASRDDVETTYFLARLAAYDETLVAERESLLNLAIRADEAHPKELRRWIDDVFDDLGALLVEAQKLDEAIAVYGRGLAAKPGDLDLLKGRGRAYWQASRNSEAEADFRAVLEKAPRDAQSLTDLGFVLWAQDRNGQAVEAFRKALDLGDRRSTLYNGLGLALNDDGDAAGAVQAYREAIRLDPRWARPRLNLAKLLLDQGNLVAAEKEAAQAVRLEPGDLEFCRVLADARVRRGDVDGAAQAYRDAIAAKAPEAEALAAMGDVLTQAGRPGEALEPLRRAVRLDEAMGKWHRYLGSAYEAMKRFDEAEAAYREAIRIDPKEATYHAYLGSLVQDLRRDEEALKEFAVAEELAPSYGFVVEQTAVILSARKGAPAVLDYLGPRLERFKDNGAVLRRYAIACHETGRLEEAERVLRQAVAAVPGYDLSHDSLAVVLDDAGRRDAAIDAVRQGLREIPASANLQFRLGMLLSEAGRPAEAEASLRKAVEIDPRLATAWNSLGAVLDQLGRTSDSIPAFERAVELRQGFTLARLNLAKAYRRAGRREDSIAAFRKALEEDPKIADAWSLLAEQLLQAGRLDEATEALDRGLSIEPKHPGLRNVLGDLLLARKDEDRALQAYHEAQEVAAGNDYPFRKESDVLDARQDYVQELDLLERWLARFPESAYALRQKGIVLSRTGRHAESREAFRAAIALSEKDWLAWTGVGDAEFNEGRLEPAREAYARAVSLNASSAASRGALAETLKRLGREEEAIAEYRKAIEVGDRAKYRVSLAEMLRRRGGSEEAEALLREPLERAASPPSDADRGLLGRALADLYEATSRPAKAVPLMEGIVSANPTDLAARRELARALRGAGRLEQAAKVLEDLLALDADDQEALAMLRALPKGVADVETFLRTIRPAPLEIDPFDAREALARFKPDDPRLAELLKGRSLAGIDHLQVEVREGGLLTQTTNQILWPLDRATADAYGEYRIAWKPAREQLEVHRARVHLPDGRVLDAAPEAYHRVSPSDTTTQNVYSDRQILVISLPQVQPGAAIDVEFTRKMKSTLTDQQWWLSWAFQSSSPYLRSGLTIRTAKGSPLAYGSVGTVPKPEVREDGARVVYRWDMSHLPGLREETNGPPMENLRASVQVTSYESWDAVARWYQGLIRNQYDLDSAARVEIEGLIKDVKDPVERVRRLYDHLQQTVRYVAVELGISSYQPHRASETLRNRYGDCKDRGTLLIAMLKVAGIRALPALVGTRESGAIVHAAPNPGQFNHLVVYLPELVLPGQESGGRPDRAGGSFIDATTEHNDLGVLPAGVQGIEAFVVEEGKGRFIRTSTSSPSWNLRALKRLVDVQADGSARLTDDATAHGHFATRFRETLSGYDERGRKDLVIKSVRDEFPGATDIEFTLTGADRPGSPPRDYETFRVPGFVKSVGNSWVLSLEVLDIIEDLLPITPASERTVDYHAEVPMTQEEEVEIRLPPGRAFTEWPDAVRLEIPQATFTLTLTPVAATSRAASGTRGAVRSGAPGAVLIQGRLVLKERVVPLPAYAPFASLIERARAAGHVTLLAR